MFSKNNDKTISYVAFAFVYGYNENEMTVTNAELNILATGYVTKQSEDSKDDFSVSAGNDSDDDTEVDNYVDYEVLSESVDKTKPFMQTSSEYDSTGNYVTSETNEQGSTTHYVYDVNGDVTSITDADENVTSYTYDSSGNLTSVKNGDSENSYTYSGLGSVSKITHNGFSYSFNHDVFYNLVSTKIGNVAITSNTYDSNGNLAKTTYANGDYFEYTYDDYGNISLITGETGKIAEMIYNKQGLVTKAVDYSSGETSYYYYTFDGSLESEYRTSSDGSITYYIVTDSDGNTVEKTFVNGQTKTITTGTDKGAKNMKKIIQPISILLIITLLSAICIIPYAATIVNGGNGNYEFTVMDATNVQKYVVGMIDLTDDEKFLYDTNGDNVLTVIDATNIQKIIVGSQFDTSEPSSLTETTSVYGTEASTESSKMTTENMKFTETTISDFSSACTEVTTEYTETTAYTETTTECVEETTIVDEPLTESTESTTEEVTAPSTESTETTTEEVTEPLTEEYTEQITEQPTTEPKPTVPPKSVKFNKNEITLGVGESYTLITTIENGDISQVAFTTSDRKVATVDNNGKITAVGTGTATITANTYNGLKTQCKVTVKKLANSIKLDKTSITLGTGEQYDFSSYVPSGTAAYFRSYYSDDPNIAFVQKAGGLMTAKKAGTTTVRCKMPNGTEATCNVTVKPLATSLKLNASEIVLYIGQSFDLNSSIPKGTAAYYRLYSSNNSKIATATRAGGIVKGISVGRTTVTCTLNNGKKAICDVYVVPKAKKISNVPLIGQSKLPTGCETCSATMLLKHYGYNISETTFADKYLVKKPFGYSNGSYTGPDPNCAFVGTPYSSNSYGAYAPIMVKCMNKYLSDKSYKAVEISGKSLEYLSGKYVAQGQPIMIWATINMLPSFKTTSWRVNYTDENAKYKLGSYYTWIAREHCLVMTGYDNYYYYFNDPWTNARTRYSKSVVNSRYAELGKQAVVMVKK